MKLSKPNNTLSKILFNLQIALQLFCTVPLYIINLKNSLVIISDPTKSRPSTIYNVLKRLHDFARYFILIKLKNGYIVIQMGHDVN